jgi:hypothetical protein
MAMGFNAISYSGDFYVYAAALQSGVNSLQKIAEKQPNR